MSRVLELRRKKAGLVDQATTIRNAVPAGEVMTAEQRTQFDGLLVQAEDLTSEIEREERLALFGDSSAEQNPAMMGMPMHVKRRVPDTPEGAYCHWVRTGDLRAMEDVQREVRASNDTTMNVTTAADGGDLVPTGHYNEIVAKLRPLSLHERLGVTRIPGVGLTVNVPYDNETDTGEFVSTSESTGFDRDAPAVNKVAMTLVKYTKKVDLTYELMNGEDSGLLSFLGGYVADGMAATLNKLLVTEALASGTAGLTLDAAAAIGAAEVPELLYKLKARYAVGANVAWLMRRSTEGYLRGLTGNQFLFAQTPQGGGVGNFGASLIGLPQYSDDNMGDKTASGKSMAVGNWSYMYMRLDPALTVLRDPYSRAGNGEVILHYYFQAVFKLIQAEAVVYATHPTA